MTPIDPRTDDRETMTESRWRVVAAVLAVLLVAALAGCFLLWRDGSDVEDHSADEAAASEAAEQVVASWLTYDYRTYEKDLAWVAEDGTDSFQEEYSPEDLTVRKKMVGQRRLVSRGRVVESAATWEKDGTVKVIVFTDQTLTDLDIRQHGRPALHARSGVELTMVREDGEWLVDKLVQLQFE